MFDEEEDRLTEEAYQVEDIIDYKKKKNGAELYLVKWVGYEEATWEKLDHLGNCISLLENFWDKHPEKRESYGEHLDFRYPKNETGFSKSDDEDERVITDRSEELAPYKTSDSDDDIEPTSFHDMQQYPFMFVRNEPETCRKYFSGFFDVKAFEKATKWSERQKFRIIDVAKVDDELMVKTRSVSGKVENVPYDIFAALFPESLASFLEIKMFKV